MVGPFHIFAPLCERANLVKLVNLHLPFCTIANLVKLLLFFCRQHDDRSVAFLDYIDYTFHLVATAKLGLSRIDEIRALL